MLAAAMTTNRGCCAHGTSAAQASVRRNSVLDPKLTVAAIVLEHSECGAPTSARRLTRPRAESVG
jgi:hypothetical protein